jgi:probable rRNA maturation factor
MKAGEPMTGRGPALTLEVQLATRSRRAPSKAQFRRWARASLERPAEVTLRIVGEREGQALNDRFRGRPRATNVLTFCYRENGRLAGDIVLCAPVIVREARAQGKSLESHYAHLTVHALLHLQGYDHDDSRKARVMEAREVAILRQLGFPDPYLTPPPR